MDWVKKYDEWENSPFLPTYLKEELRILEPEAKAEQFYKFLDFGTGGMRGEIGVGTNRINVVMVRRVTEALSQFLLEAGLADQGVVISYDNRHFSKEFAHETAKVLTNHKIKVYLSDFMRPTPIVSLMVREKKAAAGVMITASHNPSQYNGYKVYGEDGCQITLEYANELSKRMQSIEHEALLNYPEIDEDYLVWLDEATDNLYLEHLTTVEAVKGLSQEHGDQLTIVYTPLHGTGKTLVSRGLIENGYQNTYIVEEQADYDSQFSTVKLPNPEEQEAFTLAIKKAEELKADIILATDPDSDRVGVAVKHNGSYQLLNGNEMGAIIFHYLVNHTDLTATQYHLIKTIVTSDLVKRIAADYQVTVDETLTGFKFIGEQIAELENQAAEDYLFGFEESYGYLVKSYVRDKDAIQATKIIAEIALALKLKGITLIDQLQAIFEEYGYFKESLINRAFDGAQGMKEMEKMLDNLRQNPPTSIGNFKVQKMEDYLTGERFNLDLGTVETLALPKSNVLKFYLSEDEWIVIRPSGTEPKSKIYISINDKNEKKAVEKLNMIKKSFLEYIQTV